MRKQSNAKYATFCGLAMLVTLGFTTLQRGFAQDSNACNNRLIEGTYGFTIEGQKLVGAGPVGLQVGVAMATYDGVGGFTQIDTVTIDGTVVADFTHTRATGTYTVNPDCTGTFTIDFTERPPARSREFRGLHGWLGDRYRGDQRWRTTGYSCNPQHRETTIPCFPRATRPSAKDTISQRVANKSSRRLYGKVTSCPNSCC